MGRIITLRIWGDGGRGHHKSAMYIYVFSKMALKTPVYSPSKQARTHSERRHGAAASFTRVYLYLPPREKPASRQPSGGSEPRAWKEVIPADCSFVVPKPKGPSAPLRDTHTRTRNAPTVFVPPPPFVLVLMVRQEPPTRRDLPWPSRNFWRNRENGEHFGVEVIRRTTRRIRSRGGLYPYDDDARSR